MSFSDTLAKAVLSTSSDAIIAADKEGIIRFWNPGAERIFGYARGIFWKAESLHSKRRHFAARRSVQLHCAVVVAMIAMRMMQPSGHEVIDVIALSTKRRT
jgi:PAS domain-containing protein